MITRFVLNTVLHRVGLSRIISSNKQMKYYIKENNHPDWLNKGPEYNTAICSKLHGTVFDDLIRNYRSDRCNIMCFITANDKSQPTYVDYARSGVSKEIPNNATTAAFEALGVTLKFIDCWLKLFHNNYEVRPTNYNEAIKNV